jgi:hypothetical protein
MSNNPDELTRYKAAHEKSKAFMAGDLAGKIDVVYEVLKSEIVEEFMSYVSLAAATRPKLAKALLFADSHLYNNGNPRFVLEHLTVETS